MLKISEFRSISDTLKHGHESCEVARFNKGYGRRTEALSKPIVVLDYARYKESRGFKPYVYIQSSIMKEWKIQVMLRIRNPRNDGNNEYGRTAMNILLRMLMLHRK